MKPDWFLRLYPRKWRERYGAELLALIDESRLSGPRVAGDLLAGALREQLRAAFVTVSPRRRQFAIKSIVTIVCWAVGAAAAAAIALALPDTQHGGTVQSTLLLAGVFSILFVFYYMSVLRKNAPVGLAAGIAPFTPAMAALIVLLTLATTVIADLQLAHAYHVGHSTLGELFQGSMGRAITFGPVGRGLAAMFWPDEFRDLNTPSSSSTLGLDA